MARKGRRPAELDSPKVTNLIAALRAGNYFEHACAYAGLAPSTAYRWLERGRKEQQSQADGNKPDPTESHYLELCESIEKARADAIVGNVAIIQTAAKNGTWQAAAWWLERTMPNQYGRQIKAEVTQIDRTTDADADIARIIEFLDQVDKSEPLALDEGAGEA
jgi:hypothetical protein